VRTVEDCSLHVVLLWTGGRRERRQETRAGAV
jgi:hypothetical protein